LHAISDEVRRSGTRVVQVGEGSDELFAGYRGYAFFADFHRKVWQPYRVLPRRARESVFRVAAPRLKMDRADVLERASQGGELYWGGAIAFFDSHKRRLLRRPDRVGSETVRRLYADVDLNLPDASQLERMIGIELRQRLPELLLMRVDKVTMGSSIEARVPYLDHRLVELALAIPADLKYHNGVTKWILKQVARRVGVDPTIVGRSKRGFCGSATNMLTPRLLARAEEAILASPLARDRFDTGYILQMLAEQRGGRVDHAFRLWTLWNLVEWHQCWFGSGAGARTARQRKFSVQTV
ncbi:MAG: hypothetical protein JO023_11270, partial [Chloroflexi bacterium]|nr:hypothetical protein [Chloroflexota bacterium]